MNRAAQQIEDEKNEIKKTGIDSDASTATLEVARGEKTMFKITNANLSGQAAHNHKDLFARIVNAVDLDPTGIKFAISRKDRDTSRIDGTKIIIAKELDLYEFLITFVAMLRRIRFVIDREDPNEEVSVDRRKEIGRAYADLNLTEIRAALNGEEQHEWDRIVAEITARNMERAAAKKEEREREARWPIEAAEKEQKRNEKRKLEILENMAKNLTYEYSWRVEELGVVGYLEKHYATWLHYCNPENNKHMQEAEVDGQEAQVAELLRMAKHIQADEIRSVVKFRRWASGGSPGSHMDELAKAQAGAQFAEWLDDVIECTSRWLGIERPEAGTHRTLGW